VQWDEVAEGLGSGRTPAGCLSQYQRCHKGDALLNSKWTPEEATRLAQVIAELGTRDWQVAIPALCLSSDSCPASDLFVAMQHSPSVWLLRAALNCQVPHLKLYVQGGWALLSCLQVAHLLSLSKLPGVFWLMVTSGQLIPLAR